jgi:hypothetical protein
MAIFIGEKYQLDDNSDFIQATEYKTGKSVLFIPVASPDYNHFNEVFKGGCDVDGSVDWFLQDINEDSVLVKK